MVIQNLIKISLSSEIRFSKLQKLFQLEHNIVQ